jgi:anti-anti-sigma factor
VDFEVIKTPLGDGEALSVAVFGELDLASCERLKPALDEAVFARRPLILDLSGCSFIDSSGLRVVVQVAQDLTGDGEDRAVPMAIVAGEGSAVRKMLALTAIDLRTPVFEAPDEATTWIDGRQKPNGQPNSSSKDALP